MPYLLDTGILLRIVDRRDPQHALVSRSVRSLITHGESLFIATQNVAEFCNVATRPIANNGLGLAPQNALTLFEREIESACSILFEPASVFGGFKRLIAKYSVTGKQVHDARLVAMMLAWQIENVLTLNDRDFRRYAPEGIQIVTPDSLISANP
jgi:predicted nucleic acid-binding protein